MDIIIDYIYQLITFLSYIIWIFIILLIVSHFISRLVSFKKKSLKIHPQSLVIITGGCLGLGRQMAIQIAKKYHCKIMILDYRKDLFKQITSVINQLGATPQCYYCDLVDDSSVQNFINHLKQKKLKIDLFIHNAGIFLPKRALQTSQKQFLMQYKVNFFSPVKIIKQTFELMQNSHIAVIASMTALAHGGIDVSGYSSTKYALYSYINCLRQQLKMDGKNVSISMACPYLIRTGMIEGFKTRLDFLFLTLDTEYVAKRLIKQFIARKQISYIYQYESLLFKIVGLFPTNLLDYLSINFNISNFQKIKEKHTQRAQLIK